MSDQTPSQAEGERDDDQQHRGRQEETDGADQAEQPRGHGAPRQTPSQAEGERPADDSGR